MADETKTPDQDQPQAEQLKPQHPKDKYPTLYPLVEKLEKEKEGIRKRSAPLREQREAIVKQIQPLEAKLQSIDAKIHEIERPRLAEIHNELGALARAMGGRAMNADTGGHQ